MTEDKYRNKYKELKRRVRDIEEENDILHVRIHKARKSINRLRLERTFLLERMEKVHHHSNRSGNTANTLNDSDHSDIGYDDEMYRTNSHVGGKRGRIDKMLKAPKKKKDPNAPKGPGNVFFLYCRLERDKIKDEFPQENLGDVTKLLGQKWKGLTTDEKQKYYDMYKKEMEEYEEAMKLYVANGGTANLVTSNEDPNSQPPDEEEEEEEGDVVVEEEEEEEEDDMEDEEMDDDIVATGISTMSSPTHLSSVASPPSELNSDLNIPQPDEDIEMVTPAGGLAMVTTTTTTKEVLSTNKSTQQEEEPSVVSSNEKQTNPDER